MTKKAKIIIGILTALVLAAGAGAYYAWINSYQARNVVDIITSVIDVKKDEPEAEIDRPLYYFYDDQSYKVENTEEAVKRSKSAIFQMDFDGLDQFAMKLPLYWWEHYQYVGKMSSNEFVFANPDATYIINPEKKTSELFVKNEVRSILSSHDGKKLAYVVKDPNSGIDWYSDPGQLWVYNIETEKHTKLAQAEGLLYAGMRVGAWNNDDTKIYVNSAGGDGGGAWNKMEEFDLNAPEKGLQERVIEHEGVRKFWHINPTGEYYVGQKCSSPKEGEFYFGYSCPAGEEIVVYSTKDQSVKIIYTNLPDPKIKDPAKAGLVYGINWLDDNTIIFTEEDRHDLIAVNVVSSEKKILVDEDRDFASVLSDRAGIDQYMLVSDRYIVALLGDSVDEEDYLIAYDLKTKKVKKIVVDRSLDPNDPGKLFRYTERFLFAY